jgi:hypothetical protein
MSEEITGAVWPFCWGLAAASGVLGGTILGLIAQLPLCPIIIGHLLPHCPSPKPHPDAKCLTLVSYDSS